MLQFSSPPSRQDMADLPSDEEASTSKTTKFQVINQHLLSDIDTKWTDIILIICGFVGGLVDGNCVFIGLGASGQPEYPAYLWAKALASVSTFIFGNIFFSRLMRFLGSKRRGTYIICFTMQASTLLIASLVVQFDIVSERAEDPRAPIAWIQILPISMLAFQAAGQIVASRTLEYDELPTVVLTTMLSDLLIDPNLFAKDNSTRNRRAACFVALILGAMTAGGLFRLTGIKTSLWFAFALKAAITLSWCFWKASD
ncbi:hypothetical protein UA08_02136 [Talaromyces atroroseus]|uniref:DUF1275 domain protein n=1 Tax=Talaromyces atroroseus TaxID=1441469 RepID=A0A225AYZ0_TALAT|nr:hypothetical protein UA08_02136 [Talaromyces atroroseus]OKL62568.1 hypothetical protein UA08_02136 [Talaromyces atroroseus]